MAIRNIYKEGESILRKRSRQVDVFDKKLADLLDDMLETMRKAEGCGIAGPQVGMLKRVAIVEVEAGDVLEMVNPVITASSGEQIDMEGCLSVDRRKNCKVKRPMKVTIEARDRHGKKFTLTAEGFKARAICHELDHLDGILFIDKGIRE